MNTGQTILAIGALVLLGTTILSINRSSLTHGVILQQTEIGLYGVSLATGMIEEATGKAFDEYTAPDAAGETDVATAVTQFTSPTLLGKETGETVFDDFDDYNYFNANPKVVYIPGVDTMKIRCVVGYINPSNPDVFVATQTWHKKMIVYVTGSATQDTIKVATIFSYWWFR
jgi:hypothetical protein